MARPRDPAIDRAVVDACVVLLGEVGRARLTRAGIARRAGVSLPAVTRRYASVEDVLVAVASSPPRAPGEVPGLTSLRDFLLAWLTRTAHEFGAGTIRRPAAELLAATAGDAAVQEAFQSTVARVRGEGLGWVEHARRQGTVRDDVDGELLLDLVSGAAYYRLLWRGEALTEADVAPLVDLVLRGAA